MVQFCSRQYSILPMFHTSYPAHNIGAALALAHHITCAFAHATASQLSRCREVELRLPQSRAELGADVVMLIAAMLCMLDKLLAVLEQIGAKLPARARQIM